MAITAYLLYEDASTALVWLGKAFGLRKSGRAMRGPDGKVNHAAMALGDAFVMLGHPGPDYRSPKRLGQATQSLYVDVDDVDKHFRRAVKAGAKIIQEPTDTFYGHRRYGAEDPEGHQWYFAQEIAEAKAPAKRRSARKKSTKAKTRR
jgi:uncharacterized glyoxalase superfamily protein PhnB